MLYSGQSYENLYLLNLLLTPDFLLYNNLGAYKLVNHPHAMKASMTHNPDTYRLYEAISDEHLDDLPSAMVKCIADLEQRNTWKVVKKTSLPLGANLLPSTWAFKINRYPDGRMRKNKARFCVRGDCQIKILDYFESYAPVASWSTIQMVINISDQRVWATW